MLILNRLSGFGAGGAAPPLELAFLTSVKSGDGNVTIPANVVAGDLLVFLETYYQLSSVPSGFTEAVSASSIDNYTQKISYKVAIGNEANSSIGFDRWSVKILAVFRGSRPIKNASFASSNGQGTGNKPADQIVTAASGTAPLVVIAGYAGGSTLTRGFNPAKDGEISQSGVLYVWLAYKVYNSSPSNVTVSMNDSGNLNILQSCYIQVS